MAYPPDRGFLPRVINFNLSLSLSLSRSHKVVLEGFFKWKAKEIIAKNEQVSHI